MITAWFKNLKTVEEQTQFKNMLLSSTAVLDRMKELLKEMEADLDRSETEMKAYENPNWAYLQADKNGFRRALKAINKLITLDQKDT